MTIRTYDIKTLDPAPAMTETVTKFRGTYRDAVRAAHEQFRAVGRRVAVSSEGCLHWWHRVAEDVFTDRNINSGVRPNGRVRADDGDLFEGTHEAPSQELVNARATTQIQNEMIDGARRAASRLMCEIGILKGAVDRIRMADPLMGKSRTEVVNAFDRARAIAQEAHERVTNLRK